MNWPQVIFNSGITGSLYLISAVGLTLTYGLSRFPNFAHAEFMSLGAYTGYWVAEQIIVKELTGKADIVATVRYDPAKLDYLTELQIIKDKNPDAVVHVGYHDDGQIVFKQALQVGLDNAQWILAESVYAEATLEMAEAAEFMTKAAIGTRLTAPEGLAAYDEFAKAYEEEFGETVGVYADTVYDATKLVLLAIAKVGADDGAKLKDALREVGKNYQGVSGTITFNKLGDRTSGDFEVWKVVKENGKYKYERVKTISL